MTCLFWQIDSADEYALLETILMNLENLAEEEGVEGISFIFDWYDLCHRKPISVVTVEVTRCTGRTTHNLRGTASPFQFLAQLQQRGDTWVAVWKVENYMHNYPVSKEVYMKYPAPTSIYSNISTNSKHRVTMNDVRNLIAPLWQSQEQLSDDDAVAEVVHCTLSTR
ncbi:hypothetical protein GQ600_23819 [Phytophthora cactorum]|nr:hypothetical protein GQ600_23819 [Phytophthora cactorum]